MVHEEKKNLIIKLINLKILEDHNINKSVHVNNRTDKT